MGDQVLWANLWHSFPAWLDARPQRFCRRQENAPKGLPNKRNLRRYDLSDCSAVPEDSRLIQTGSRDHAREFVYCTAEYVVYCTCRLNQSLATMPALTRCFMWGTLGILLRYMPRKLVHCSFKYAQYSKFKKPKLTVRFLVTSITYFRGNAHRILSYDFLALSWAELDLIGGAQLSATVVLCGRRIGKWKHIFTRAGMPSFSMIHNSGSINRHFG